MTAFTRIYLSLYPWIGFAPLLITFPVILATLRLARHRWVVHTLTFIALLATFPLYVWIQGILDPTTTQYTTPADGFVLVLYVFCLVPSLIVYSAYAWFTRRRAQTVQFQSAS
ncbi:MAG TPA: hypothetical protein VGG01_18650 [Xanthobacteraceae bacterium]|jgi:hypothetical protein